VQHQWAGSIYGIGNYPIVSRARLFSCGRCGRPGPRDCYMYVHPWNHDVCIQDNTV